MPPRRLRHNGLDGWAVEGSPTHPTLVVVMCHGYGAPGDDLVPIGSELLRASPILARRARFLFPAAPILLGAGYGIESRAWWPIDAAALDRAVSRGEYLEWRDQEPDGMADARARLAGFIEEAAADAAVPWSRVAIAGFSQGAMLASDVALRWPECPAALGVFSGTLLTGTEWRRLAPGRQGLRVVQSHGTRDPLLPFHGAEALRDLFTASGLLVDFLAFPGAHEIPMQPLIRWMRLLESLVPES